MRFERLFVLLLFSFLSVAEAQYYGTRVSEIQVEGAPAGDILTAISLRPGDLLTTDNVRNSVEVLYAHHGYSYVEVEALPAANGTRLIFRVRPAFFFSTFRLQADGLLDRPLSGFVRLPYGEKFSRSTVDRIVHDVIEILKSHGYFNAAITPEFHFDDQTRLVSVTLNTKSPRKATIRNIEFLGGQQTFTPAELSRAFKVSRGEFFSTEELDRAIDRVKTKFRDLGFLNTRVAILEQRHDVNSNAIDLRIGIEEGPFTLVETRGYDIPKKKLQELVPVFEEGSVDVDLIEEGRAAIIEHMRQKGFFEARVTTDLIQAPLDNAFQINYIVEPGERHRIQQIRIEGNSFFTSDSLESRLKIREGGLVAHGVFSTDLLEQDLTRLTSLYRSAGFEDAVVRGNYEERNHEITVVIRIEEGKRSVIEAVRFVGHREVTEEELRRRIRLAEGQFYTPSALEVSRNAITQIYFANGFPNVQVEAVAEKSATGQGTRVTFHMTEGDAYQVGRILVAGNSITQEKIIHRNSGLYRATPFNPEAILTGQQRLYATGLFDRVDVVPLDQVRPGTRNLLIQVEDARPFLLTYGFGLQDGEGPRGTVEISHSNLFGLDRSISFRVRGSRREQRFQSTYREPRLFNRDLDGFASLFVERTHQRFFDASRVDFSFQSLKRLHGQNTLLVSMSYQTVNLRDIRVNPKAPDFPEERGIIQIAGLGASLIRDQRDDTIDPQSGTFSTINFRLASRALGSEVNFTSLFAQANYYRPVNPALLAMSFRFGWNQPYGKNPPLFGRSGLPITERYFAGGSTSLRGFDLDKAGPEGGGNAVAIANLEYRFPRVFPFAYAPGVALFYDTGNVFERISDFRLKDFTHTAGFGLRYKTRFGPVRLDFGVNLRRRPGDDPRHVQLFFTLGHTF